jgi:hypothetical protein
MLNGSVKNALAKKSIVSIGDMLLTPTVALLRIDHFGEHALVFGRKPTSCIWHGGCELSYFNPKTAGVAANSPRGAWCAWFSLHLRDPRASKQ